jgi:hypothetical protein
VKIIKELCTLCHKKRSSKNSKRTPVKIKEKKKKKYRFKANNNDTLKNKLKNLKKNPEKGIPKIKINLP